jgi:hypothetical protein
MDLDFAGDAVTAKGETKAKTANRETAIKQRLMLYLPYQLLVKAAMQPCSLPSRRSS